MFSAQRTIIEKNSPLSVEYYALPIVFLGVFCDSLKTNIDNFCIYFATLFFFLKVLCNKYKKWINDVSSGGFCCFQPVEQEGAKTAVGF